MGMEKYNEKDIQEWRDWVPDIVDMTLDGVVDAQAKDLAKAAITRLTDENELKAVMRLVIRRASTLGFIQGEATDDEGAAKPATGEKSLVGAAAYAVGFNKPVVGENGMPLISTTLVSTGVISTSSGGRYRKTSIEGKFFRTKIPGNVTSEMRGKHWFLDDLLIEVLAVGNKNIRFKFACDPTPRHPNSYQLQSYWHKQQKGGEFTLPIDFIQHALEAH